MFKRAIVSAALMIVAGATPALAQQRFAISGWGGYSFSDGVDGQSVVAGNGQLYDRVDPKDGGIFGFNIGFLTPANGEVGFMYSYQFSALVFGGPTAETNVGDMGLSTYHGYFAYNFLDPDSAIRPFIFIGFGATNFGSVGYNVGNQTGSTSNETKFSSTWGAGANYFPAPKVGIRFAVRWTPTYIKSDASGWWCDPYWGCYVTGNPQYANQLDLTGGVTVRF